MIGLSKSVICSLYFQPVGEYLSVLPPTPSLFGGVNKFKDFVLLLSVSCNKMFLLDILSKTLSFLLLFINMRNAPGVPVSALTLANWPGCGQSRLRKSL